MNYMINTFFIFVDEQMRTTEIAQKVRPRNENLITKTDNILVRKVADRVNRRKRMPKNQAELNRRIGNLAMAEICLQQQSRHLPK